jgi:uncharacterized membrane protein YhaH (DUF805 family)
LLLKEPIGMIEGFGPPFQNQRRDLWKSGRCVGCDRIAFGGGGMSAGDVILIVLVFLGLLMLFGVVVNARRWHDRRRRRTREP